MWVHVRTLFLDGPQTLTRFLRGFSFLLSKKRNSLPTPLAAWEEAAAGEEDWVSDGRTPGGLVLREVGARKLEKPARRSVWSKIGRWNGSVGRAIFL